MGADGSNTGAFSFTNPALARPSDAPAEQNSSHQEPGSIFDRDCLCVARSRPVHLYRAQAAGALWLSMGSPTDMKNWSCPAGVHMLSRRAGHEDRVGAARDRDVSQLRIARVGQREFGGRVVRRDRSCAADGVGHLMSSMWPGQASFARHLMLSNRRCQFCHKLLSSKCRAGPLIIISACVQNSL